MYDTLLFDLDGTLTNPEEGITNCVKYALESFDIIETNREKLIAFIGPPLKTSFMGIYNMTESQADSAVAKYRERFAKVGMYENKVFDGVPQMLKALKEKGFKTAIATSKPIEFAREILRYFDLLKYFDLTVGPELNKGLGEKSEIVAEAISRLGVSGKSKMIMIGDREMDVLGAKENGIASVGVTYGFAVDGELENAGADYIVNSIKELETLLLSFM